MDSMGLTDSTCGTVELGPGVRVRRLGYGAMRLCGEGAYGPPPDPAAAGRVLRRVVDLGINLIDTADAYGPGHNEELIGSTLSPFPDDLVIATKGGAVRGADRSWSPNGTPVHLRAACEASLARLGVGTIDLYQLHAPDPDVPLAESVGCLAELREEGKIRLVGLSNVSVDELREAQAVTAIASVQNAYNLHDREHHDVLGACESEGIAFLPYFPLKGFGYGDGTALLARIGQAHGTSPAAVALAWLLARSPVVAPIPGTASTAHVEENVASASLALEPHELDQLDRFRPGLKAHLGRLKRRLGRLVGDRTGA